MIEYSNFQVGRGRNAFIVMCPIFYWSEQEIDLQKVRDLSHIKYYKQKFIRHPFNDDVLTMRYNQSFNNNATWHSSGCSRTGTGRLDYLHFSQAVNLDGTLNEVRWLNSLVYANNVCSNMITPYYIPYRLENMLSEEEWARAVEILVNYNTNTRDVTTRYVICQAAPQPEYVLDMI